MNPHDSGSSSILWLGVLAVGGYLVYTNWASVESWLGSMGISTGATASATSSPSTSVTSTPMQPVAVVTSTQPPSAPAAYQVSVNGQVTNTSNNAIQASVTVNGQTMTVAVIPANVGQASGVVYNTAGQDITSQFNPSTIQNMAAAMQIALGAQVQSELPTIPGGLGFIGLGLLPTSAVMGYRGTPSIPINAIHRGMKWA